MKKKMRMTIKNTKLLRLIIPAIAILLGFFALFQNTLTVFGRSNLPNINTSELSKFNGDDPKLPVYLAMNGYVYDVTTGRELFYKPGMPYHYLAGQDSSNELNMFGGNIIKTKYKVVAKYIP